MRRVLFIDSFHLPLMRDWRGTAFVKIPPEFGWPPIVISADENVSYGKDYSLLSLVPSRIEVHRVDHMVTLDEIRSNLGISHIDHMKIDVEGATIAALKGAVNVISTYRPKTIIEVGHYPDEASETKSFLSHYGYTTYINCEIMYAELKGE